MRPNLSAHTTIAERDPTRAARLLGTHQTLAVRPSVSITPEQLASVPDARPSSRAKVMVDRPPATDRHPVRSNAVCVQRNPTMWVPIDRNARVRLLVAAKAIEKQSKAKGRADGAVGRSGLVVLQALLWYASLGSTGRCDPSLETIAAK